MSQAWAVARLMIAEGIRMKIALVFLALIGMVILGVPLTIKGDSSLTGAVQSFMSYGLSATAVLLSMLTIFMSRSLSDEFVHHQIFLVMSKPVPRWQFIVGKWLGMTVLNAAFLACAGATIYGMVYYIKSTHPPIDNRYDEAELVNEVLVARHALQTKIPDFSDDAELEFERNLEQGLYANAGDIRPDAATVGPETRSSLACGRAARRARVRIRERPLRSFKGQHDPASLQDGGHPIRSGRNLPRSMGFW